MKTVNEGVTYPQGFLANGADCAIKKPGVLDMAVIYSQSPSQAAGVFTTNQVKAACVVQNMETLKKGTARAIIVNAGNANACTGTKGLIDNRKMAELTADQLKVSTDDVLVASTGVIGVNMPMERVAPGIARVCADVSREGWVKAAEAIMTTDTMPKTIAVEFEVNGVPVKMGAMAKGSGMIHPNMATMLAFITTDAAVTGPCLSQALKDATVNSFNMISVDGDTSTNDMALILANGMAGNPVIDDQSSEGYAAFKAALDAVTVFLAKAIARDGEGATRLIEVTVDGAVNDLEARKVAKSVIGSNLFKAAVFGEDANWGRIICAAGYSEAQLDPALIDIYLGSQQVAQGGMGIPFDEEIAKQDLRLPVVAVKLTLNQGGGSAVAWGCDLTFEYVKINASYRS